MTPREKELEKQVKKLQKELEGVSTALHQTRNKYWELLNKKDDEIYSYHAIFEAIKLMLKGVQVE